jgi:hypothetical protein
MLSISIGEIPKFTMQGKCYQFLLEKYHFGEILPFQIKGIRAHFGEPLMVAHRS